MRDTKNKFTIRPSMYKILVGIILLISLIHPLSLFWQQRDVFFNKGYEKQYENYKKAYYSSQYVKKKNPAIIPDEIFEAFAGGAFLRGLNPILIVHDHPPLGRYIISLSIFLFDNVNTIMLPLLSFAVLGIFLIGRMVTGKVIFALIPMALFINEPLFFNKILYSPLPEAVNLPFIIFAFYFFIKSINTKRYIPWFLATALMLGFVISIRFFVLGAVMLSVMGIFLLLRQRDVKRIGIFIACLPLSILILFLSYTRTMLDGYSPLQIVGVQKYILVYHKSLFILPFSYWDLLLFNRWHTWWGNKAIITDENWVIFWPISVIITFGYSLFAIIKRIKISDYELVLLFWVFMYSVMLSTGYTSSRYFLPVIPFFYILATSFSIKAIATLGDRKGKTK